MGFTEYNTHALAGTMNYEKAITVSFQYLLFHINRHIGPPTQRTMKMLSCHPPRGNGPMAQLAGSYCPSVGSAEVT